MIFYKTYASKAGSRSRLDKIFSGAGKYLFLRERISTARSSDMTLAEIALMLKRDRVKFHKEKPVNGSSKAILLRGILSKEELLFESLGQCINFF